MATYQYQVESDAMVLSDLQAISPKVTAYSSIVSPTVTTSSVLTSDESTAILRYFHDGDNYVLNKTG